MQEQISANDARACVMVVMLLMIPGWKISRAVDKERGKNPVCVCGEALCSLKCYENKDQTEAQIWYVDKICSNGFNYS